MARLELPTMMGSVMQLALAAPSVIPFLVMRIIGFAVYISCGDAWL